MASQAALEEDDDGLDMSDPRNSEDLTKAHEYVAQSDVTKLAKLRVAVLKRCCKDFGKIYEKPKATAAAVLCGLQVSRYCFPPKDELISTPCFVV